MISKRVSPLYIGLGDLVPALPADGKAATVIVDGQHYVRGRAFVIPRILTRFRRVLRNVVRQVSLPFRVDFIVYVDSVLFLQVFYELV